MIELMQQGGDFSHDGLTSRASIDMAAFRLDSNLYPTLALCVTMFLGAGRFFNDFADCKRYLLSIISGLKVM